MKIEERRAPYTNVGTLCGIMDLRSNSSARQLDKGRNPRIAGGPTGPCMLLVKGAHKRLPQVFASFGVLLECYLYCR